MAKTVTELEQAVLELSDQIKEIEQTLIRTIISPSINDPTATVRYRFNRATTTKGVESWDCTAETNGFPLDMALNLSDQVVSAMRARHPHLTVPNDPHAVPDPGIDPAWEGTVPITGASQPELPPVDVDPEMAKAEAEYKAGVTAQEEAFPEMTRAHAEYIDATRDVRPPEIKDNDGVAALTDDEKEFKPIPLYGLGGINRAPSDGEIEDRLV